MRWWRDKHKPKAETEIKPKKNMNANSKSHAGKEQNIDLNDKKKIPASPNRRQF